MSICYRKRHELAKYNPASQSRDQRLRNDGGNLKLTSTLVLKACIFEWYGVRLTQQL